MPNYIGAAGLSQFAVRQLSIGVVAGDGQRASATIELPAAATNAQIDAIVAAYGDMTNAGVWRQSVKDETRVLYPQTGFEVFDEMFSSVKETFIIVVQNGNRLTQTFYVYAPDAAWLQSPTYQIARGDVPQFLALQTALLAGLNEGAAGNDVWSVKTAYRSSSDIQRPPAAPSISEAGAGENPPDAPGV